MLACRRNQRSSFKGETSICDHTEGAFGSGVLTFSLDRSSRHQTAKHYPLQTTESAALRFRCIRVPDKYH